jgi:hypothetical protein
MPKFNLAPLPGDLDPQYPAAPASSLKPTKDQMNRRLEDKAGSVPLIGGLLKPMAQFANTLASPDTKAGIFTGPVNGISKLGNAIGDLVQGKPIDVKDAWTISDKQARHSVLAWVLRSPQLMKLAWQWARASALRWLVLPLVPRCSTGWDSWALSSVQLMR